MPETPHAAPRPLRPASRPAGRLLPADQADRHALLDPYFRAHGSHCLAYSSLQDVLEHFLLDGVGYVACLNFRHPLLCRKPRRIVLANPVVAKEDAARLIEAFLAFDPDPVFVQVDRDFAAILDAAGFQVNQIGVETDVPLADFDLTGKGRAKLRQWRNKTEREGVVARELPCSAVDPAEVAALSRQWLDRKGGREILFLNRPFVIADEPDVRRFYAFQDGRLVGVAVFDPFFRDGRVVGYYHNIDRLADGAPHGTGVCIKLAAVEAFRAEGREVLALGLTPLSGIDNDFNANRFMERILKIVKRYDFLYPFKGSESHKKKFDGVSRKVYAASRKSDIRTMLATSKAFGVF